MDDKGFPIGSPFLFMCFVIERKLDIWIIWILDSLHFERTESGEMSRFSGLPITHDLY